MDTKKFDKYLDEIKKYTEDVSNAKISPQKSLNSLVKAGICNKKKEVTLPYAFIK